MISVTILGRQNQFLVSRGQLMQRDPAIDCGDQKLRGSIPYSADFGLGAHIIALRHLLVVVQFDSGGRFQPEKDFSLRSK